MKIFGIGVNKTGTKSLSQFTMNLGIRTLHNRSDTKGLRDAVNRSKPSIPYVGRYDAFFDLPEDIDIEKLIERFPDARFIMTTRDTEKWITSRIIHVLHNRTVTGKPWKDIDTHAWRKQKTEHENRIRDTFKRLGKLNQLLVVDVCSNPEQAARRIMEFLEVPRKDIGFPRLNTGEHKLRQIQDKMSNPHRSTIAMNRRRGNEESETTPRPALNLLAVFHKVREYVVKYGGLAWEFCKSVRFQSPILLNRKT